MDQYNMNMKKTDVCIFRLFREFIVWKFDTSKVMVVVKVITEENTNIQFLNE